MILVSFTFEKSFTFRDSELSVAITIVIYLSVPELESSVFLDSVLLRFTAVALVLLDCQLLILRQLRCHVHVSEFFYPVEFNRAKKPDIETNVGRPALKPALESLFTFTLLVFRTKQGA